MGVVKTTLELPDDLMRSIKIRAVREDRKLKDVIAELLRRGLAAEENRAMKNEERRISLPLIHTGRAISPEHEATPERIADLLEAEEAADARW
jgi:plasmid stability protein